MYLIAYFPKFMQWKLTELKEKIEKYTIIVLGFSIFSSVTCITSKEKLLKILLNSYREKHAQSTWTDWHMRTSTLTIFSVLILSHAAKTDCTLGENTASVHFRRESLSRFLLTTVGLNYKLIIRILPKGFQLRNTILHNKGQRINRNVRKCFGLDDTENIIIVN